MAFVLGVLVLVALVSTLTLCLMAKNKSGCFAPREYLGPSTSEEKQHLEKADDDEEELEERRSNDEEVQLDSASS